MAEGGRSLVLCFLSIFCLGCVNTETVATGTSYTFKPNVKGAIETIDWRHNDNLVVEADPAIKPHWYRYEDRASLNSENGELTLQLKKEDSGVFKGQFQVQGVLQDFQQTINVMDPVSDPVVTCQQNATDKTLLCSLHPPVDAEFEWSGPNGFSSNGKSINIAGISKDSIYYCTAKNEVGKKTVEFKLETCFQGPHKNLNGGMIAGIVVGVLLLAAGAGAGVGVGVGVYLKKKKDGQNPVVGNNHTSKTPSPDDESGVPLSKQDKDSPGV